MNLRELSVWDNNLTGPLPASYADLVLLEIMDVSYNALEGCVQDGEDLGGDGAAGQGDLFCQSLQTAWCSLSSNPLPERYNQYVVQHYA